MLMYDARTIAYQGRPLFQVAKMRSPSSMNNTLNEVACFFYVLKGTNKVIDGNGLYRSDSKEGLLKSCGNFISHYLPDEEINCDFEAIVIFLYPDMLRDMYRDQFSKISLRHGKAQPPKRVVGNELVEKFIDGLFIYFENEELMDEDLARLKVKELVMILLKSNYFEGVVEFFQGLFSPKAHSFREIVENNLLNPLNLEQFAFLTHKSLSTFKREFKKVFGESPARYIKHRRLEAAANRLLLSKDSVTAIAFDCGFQDVTTFSASFRDKYQLSPREYRLNQIRK